MNDFKLGDEVHYFEIIYFKTKFIKDFGEYFTSDDCIDGPHYWSDSYKHTKNEAIDTLIQKLEKSRD